ncbi:hypothetical protein JOD64_004009 [Micromonospora luteifusca]|uniref:Uncharacterized protein n=1 Tax=Micromonospora luteifusca TaxID=709860 RepID=A0ABS2LXX4_9ACTN|nr:hypothetical protein [Micromonospora luteifusca]
MPGSAAVPLEPIAAFAMKTVEYNAEPVAVAVTGRPSVAILRSQRLRALS